MTDRPRRSRAPTGRVTPAALRGAGPLPTAVDLVSLPDPPPVARRPSGPGNELYESGLMPLYNAADEVERELDVRSGLGLFESEAQLHQLLAIARQVDLLPGQVLFERGALVRNVYQLAHGELEMRAPGEPSWRVTERGTVGFLDFMLARPYARTAVAITASRILELDAADYRDYMEDNFDVGHQVPRGVVG